MRFNAKAIGSGSEGAQTALQDEYNKSMSLGQAETLALTVLREVMEEKIDPTNVELAVIPAATKKFEIFGTDALKKLLDALPASKNSVN